MERRDFLRFAGFGIGGGLGGRLVAGAPLALEQGVGTPGLQGSKATAADEAFWRKVRTFYTPPPDYVDLDNANTSPTAAPVLESLITHSMHLSHAPAERFGKLWFGDVDKVARPRLAAYLGTQPSRLVFVPNATSGLNTVLHGFPLERGDEVLVTNHEYPDMVETLIQRSKREEIALRVVPIAAPGEDRLKLVSNLVEAITPRTKLLLISHVSAWSGEILPVTEVSKAVRAKGVAVLVDAAQSVGMLDVNFDAIGCDFLVTSLHKWLGAAIATGALVMRPEHVGRVWPLHPPSWDTTEYPMEIYEWWGTANMATHASIIEALAFQRTLGAERKRARMRYLGDYWQERLQLEQRVHVLTPLDSARSFGVAAIKVDGVSSESLAKHLRQQGILVQDKAGRHSPYKNAVRISPGPARPRANWIGWFRLWASSPEMACPLRPKGRVLARENYQAADNFTYRASHTSTARA